MPIEDWDAYKKSLWDWGFMRGWFGSDNILPTDLDGFVEKNSHFLFMETKRPGVPLKQGQRIALERLSRFQFATILNIWGEPQKPEALEIMCRSGQRTIEAADMGTLRAVCAAWKQGAERGKLPGYLWDYLNPSGEHR